MKNMLRNINKDPFIFIREKEILKKKYIYKIKNRSIYLLIIRMYITLFWFSPIWLCY